MTPVGFEPTQLALVELESTPLDHSGKVSMLKLTNRYGSQAAFVVHVVGRFSCDQYEVQEHEGPHPREGRPAGKHRQAGSQPQGGNRQAGTGRQAKRQAGTGRQVQAGRHRQGQAGRLLVSANEWRRQGLCIPACLLSRINRMAPTPCGARTRDLWLIRPSL